MGNKLGSYIIKTDGNLTEIIQGYKRQELIGDLLLPIKPVVKESGSIPSYGQDSYLVTDTKRGIRAEGKEMPLESISTKSYELQEHNLSSPLDMQEIKYSEVDIQARAARTALDRILLRREYEQATLLQTTTNYNATTTLTDDFWDEALIDPVGDIITYKDTMEQSLGSAANTIFMGQTVWNKLKVHPKIKAYFYNDTYGIVDTAKFAQLIGVDNVYVGKTRYKDEMGAQTLTNLWGNYFGILSVEPNNGDDIVNFGYTVRDNSAPIAVVDDSIMEITKYKAIDAWDLVITNDMAGYLIKNPIDPS